MYFDGLLASCSLWLRLPMPNNSPEPLCPGRVHVWLRWQKWSGNVLMPSDVLVKSGHNSASMQSKDIGGGVEVHSNGLYWVGWSESPKQVLSDGHVVERCGVWDEFILIFILCSIANLCSIFAQHGLGIYIFGANSLILLKCQKSRFRWGRCSAPISNMQKKHGSLAAPEFRETSSRENQ